ncbi:MAG: leucine-rich repeat domain-containing protein [Anaerolineae bacterium]|nr:leucine-rich repeat domain-containing protein [Anaerolineae bacterium]
MERGELLAIIERAKRDKATRLNLAFEIISELPPEIGQLTNLRDLNLSDNQLSTLPDEFVQLTNLTRLDLNNNELHMLPEGLGQLSSLSTLSLHNNQLRTLPDSLGQLSLLTKLYLHYNQLSVLPESMGELSNLTNLDLSYNHLSTLPESLGQLSNLKVLNLGDNRLSALPESLGQLSNLTLLNLGSNELSTLPESLGQLSSLFGLYLEGNRLSMLPDSLGQLSLLTRLYLHNNQLSVLPESMGELSNLEMLSLQDNSKLPIPPEILRKYEDPSTILTYYTENVLAQDRRPLNEVKMLLVGQGGVGKTSLVRRLVDDEFDLDEPMTHKINIKTWTREINSNEVRINVWDFGGQQIMHATHQFFLSKRSLYLVVLDAREEQYRDLIYWLGMVSNVGADSPVIVVANKIDKNPRFELDMVSLCQRYPNVVGYVETSCADGQGLEELANLIDVQIGEMENVSTLLSNRWFAVKEKLEHENKSFIPYATYQQYCNEAEISRDVSQTTLIGLLHDLGIALNFHEKGRELMDTFVLDPEWITQGIYTIITAQELKGSGILDLDMLDILLDSTKYPPYIHGFIIRVMCAFELCFPFDSQHRYLIPTQLPENRPDLPAGLLDEGLQFEIHYRALMTSILSRLMVRMHHCIVEELYWRNGAVFEYAGNRALVTADLGENIIKISVSGTPSTRRDLLSAIRLTLMSIHDGLPGVEFDEMVPVPKHEGSLIPYQELLDYEEMGIERIKVPGKKATVSVMQLLDSIETPEARQHLRAGSLATDFSVNLAASAVFEMILRLLGLG